MQIPIYGNGMNEGRNMKKYKYLRIQGLELAANTLYAKGIFSMCWQLIRNDVMEEEDVDLFLEIDAWFSEELPWPEPCINQEKVVCFFKTENTEEMIKMIQPAIWLLEKYNHPYFLVYTNTPGEIVYEDRYQVAVRVPGYLKIEEVQEPWGPKPGAETAPPTADGAGPERKA